MIVGLTGGIGSGKSTVAKLFATLGLPVYNSDERAKALYYDEDIKRQVTSLLGERAYGNEGKLDKEFVAQTIFKDQSLLQKINAIIHPAVGSDFKNFVKQNASSKIIIKESALLFEAEMLTQFDKIILVVAPLDLKIARIKSRDNSSEEQIMQRIKNQLPDESKMARADFIVHNDEKQALIPQVLEIFKTLNGN